MSHSIFAPRAGDVVLMNARPGVNAAIIALQSLTRRRIARFSYVGVTISDDAYLDSLANRGVGTARWADLDASSPIRAFRHRADPDRTSARVDAMLKHQGMAYNFGLCLKSRYAFNEASTAGLYCSELVARVFNAKELGLSPRQRLILPVDLEALARHPDWDDVTPVYVDLVRSKSAGTAGRATADPHGSPPGYSDVPALAA